MRVLLLVVLVACGGVDRSTVRWPAHRKDRDARIEQLEREVNILEEHVERLEQQARQPPAAPHAPDPPAPQS